MEPFSLSPAFGDDPINGLVKSYACLREYNLDFQPFFVRDTGISRQIRTKLRDWAVGQAGASCYSQAAMSSND